MAGKLTSTPVYQILNPEADATVTGQVCWSMSCNDDYFQQEIDAVEQHAKNGYGLKLKLGHNLDANIAATVALLQKYSAEKFPGIKLRVDANSAMSVEQFRAYENGVSAKINPQQLAAVDFYIEEPIDTRAYGRRRDGLRQFAELIKDSQWRIMADETIYTLDDVHDLIGLTEDCTGQLLFNIKVQRLGGLSRAMKVAELAQRHQIPIMVGGMFPASLGKVVNCHYALAVGDFLPSDGLHLSSDYVPEGMSVVRNIDHLEKMDHRKRRDLSVFRGRPGFGAEIDEDLVKNFSFDVGIDGYYPDFVNDNGNNDKRGGS